MDPVLSEFIGVNPASSEFIGVDPASTAPTIQSNLGTCQTSTVQNEMPCQASTVNDGIPSMIYGQMETLQNIASILEQFNRRDAMNSIRTLDFFLIFYNLLLICATLFVNRVIMKGLERENPSFRVRNGHNSFSTLPFLFLPWGLTVLVGYICFLVDSSSLIIYGNTLLMSCYLVIIGAVGLLSSSVFVTAYASAILLWRAESPDRKSFNGSADRKPLDRSVDRKSLNASSCTSVSPKSFYSFIREGVYIGIILFVLTSKVHILNWTLFLNILVTAVYDAISSPSLRRNINFPYKGMLFWTIGFFVYYLYEHDYESRGNYISFLACFVLSMFLTAINLIRFQFYGNGAKNDLKGEDDVMKQVLQQNDIP